jgi:uncharacterized repeat protein (TIGR01451 family)
LAVTYYSWTKIELAGGYSITPNSGWNVGPVMLNNNDQIAGTATNPGGALRAFLYSGGVTHDLGLLPGAPDDCGSGTLILSIASGLNDLGQVVGEATKECLKNRAFVYNGGSLVDLGSIDGGPSYARGINNAGSIVGGTEVSPPTYQCTSPISHAFIYQGTTMTDLGIPDGGNICDASGALAITNGGLIVGMFNGSLIVMDSATPEGGWNNLGVNGVPAAVNESGQIVGTNGTTAFLYTPGAGGGEFLDLGHVVSYPALTDCEAFDISNGGQVVGRCHKPSTDSVATAWVYSGGVMTDLNELLVTPLPGTGGGLNLPDNLLAARSINNSGKILAQGTQGYYLLTPTTYSNPPDLSITKSHSGDFLQGETDRTYTVTVSNAANAGPTVGPVRVIEELPSGLTLKYMTGNGWGCSGNVCERWQFDSLAPGSSYPPLTVHVDVAADASSPQINQVSVQAGGVTKTASDPTIIIAPLAKLSSKPGTTYPTLHEAYAAANDNDLLMARNVTFSESPLNLDRPVNLTIAGGLEADFITVNGFTTVNGSIVIGGSAVVTIGNLSVF